MYEGLFLLPKLLDLFCQLGVQNHAVVAAVCCAILYLYNFSVLHISSWTPWLFTNMSTFCPQFLSNMRNLAGRFISNHSI